MNRYLKTVLVLLVLALVGAATVTAAEAGNAERSSVLPRVGHYEGRDSHHRHVRFFYGSHRQVINFRVEHTNFPPAHVQGDKWHHTCHNNHCTRGHWINDSRVHGHWNISNAGGDVFSTPTGSRTELNAAGIRAGPLDRAVLRRCPEPQLGTGTRTAGAAGPSGAPISRRAPEPSAHRRRAPTSVEASPAPC